MTSALSFLRDYKIKVIASETKQSSKEDGNLPWYISLAINKLGAKWLRKIKDELLCALPLHRPATNSTLITRT
jgi:hypothetical protein